MNIVRQETTPFADQNPGTSGLRKKVKFFQKAGYTENFIQAIFNVIGAQGKAFIIGGDGRFYNTEVLQLIIKMAIANKVGQLYIAKDGLLSTPALSHFIRKYQLAGGIMLSASHNPGGPEGDFGIKYNMENGSAASESLTKSFYQEASQIKAYMICQMEDLSLKRLGRYNFAETLIEVIDPVKDYADLMEEIFDFRLIKKAQQKGLSFCFDAMHGVTGPYAREIFVNRLSFSETVLWREQSLPDFGGQAPDPNPLHAQALYQLQFGEKGVDLAAASDGDGDRNLIIGRKQYVTPADSLAILFDYIDQIPYYQGRPLAVARSMPTSCAVDHVARAKKLSCFETPTGWKFFGNLLDAEKIILCGEESYGTSSCHIREKDGLWAVLFWLELLAKTGKSVRQIVQDHWKNYGRCYNLRQDYENLDAEKATDFMNRLRQNLPYLLGKSGNGYVVRQADEFCYEDPIDHSLSKAQGIRIFLGPQARFVCRLSGTGTSGAILRLYLEAFEKDPFYQHQEAASYLKNLAVFASHLLGIEAQLGRSAPDIII